MNLYTYCYNDPVNYYDPSGNIAISIGIGVSTIIYYSLIALGVIAVGTIVAYVESETHFIENSLVFLGDAIADFGEYVVINIKELFYSEITSISTEGLIEEYYNIASSIADPYRRPGQKNKDESLK